jgi:hypothetical protein
MLTFTTEMNMNNNILQQLCDKLLVSNNSNINNKNFNVNKDYNIEAMINFQSENYIPSLQDLSKGINELSFANVLLQETDNLDCIKNANNYNAKIKDDNINNNLLTNDVNIQLSNLLTIPAVNSNQITDNVIADNTQFIIDTINYFDNANLDINKVLEMQSYSHKYILQKTGIDLDKVKSFNINMIEQANNDNNDLINNTINNIANEIPTNKENVKIFVDKNTSFADKNTSTTNYVMPLLKNNINIDFNVIKDIIGKNAINIDIYTNENDFEVVFDFNNAHNHNNNVSNHFITNGNISKMGTNGQIEIENIQLNIINSVTNGKIEQKSSFIEKETNSIGKESNSIGKESNSIEKETNSIGKETNSIEKETNSIEKETNSIFQEKVNIKQQKVSVEPEKEKNIEKENKTEHKTQESKSDLNVPITTNKTEMYKQFVNVKVADVPRAVWYSAINASKASLSIAKISLNPESLGNVVVEINLNSDIPVINFKVENNDALIAIKDNIDKLKELFISSGMKEINIRFDKTENNASNNNHSGQFDRQFNEQQSRNEQHNAKREYINSITDKITNTNIDNNFASLIEKYIVEEYV